MQIQLRHKLYRSRLYIDTPLRWFWLQRQFFYGSGMDFAIIQNCALQGLDKLIDRLPFIARELVECKMMNLLRITNRQRMREVVFGNLIDASDHVNSHPGANSPHIARFERVILLLETSHRLISTYSSEAYNPQHEEQEQAEQAQLDTFTRRNQLPFALSLASAKGSEKIYRIIACYDIIISWKGNN